MDRKDRSRKKTIPEKIKSSGIKEGIGKKKGGGKDQSNSFGGRSL
jgi:hypothetical protein